MEASIDDIRQRLKLLSSAGALQHDIEEFKNDIIEDMAKLSYEQINLLRSEFDPHWLTPEWFDPKNPDSNKAQREKYYAGLVVQSINQGAKAHYRLVNRPEELSGPETHDFDYRDSKTGRVIALEVVRLLEPDEPGAIVHPRSINNLIKFWQHVERVLAGKVTGVYRIMRCPLLERPKSLEMQCVQEVCRLVPSISVGQSGIFHAPDELRGTLIFKQSEGTCAFTIESISFKGYTGPLTISTRKALNQFRDTILAGKNEQLKPAKENGKTTILVAVLDYPLLDALSLVKVFQEAGCSNIDHVYLVRSWTGGTRNQKVEKAT